MRQSGQSVSSSATTTVSSPRCLSAVSVSAPSKHSAGSDIARYEIRKSRAAFGQTVAPPTRASNL